MLNMKGIHSIFKKENAKYYNKKALMYQDILVFGSTLQENEPFKPRDLAKFLLHENAELRNWYQNSKMKEYSIIENIQRRIKRNINDLVNLRLMIEVGLVKEERGTALIPTYRYTRFGHFLSQIIQCLNSDKDAEARLYDLFQKTYKITPDLPSFHIFMSNHITKMWEKGQFSQYVSILKEVIDSRSITDIRSFVLLLQNTVNLKFQNPGNALFFVDTFEGVIDQLDPDTRNWFLYDQKLGYDVKMGSKAITKDYEMLRYDLRGDQEVIALEGYCNGCNQRVVIKMKILQYIRRIAYAHTTLHGRAITCPKCNAPQRTLQLPNLWE